MSTISIIQADFTNSEHQTAVKNLLNTYAQDPMGGGKEIKEDILNKVISDLGSFPGAFSLLAFHENKACGIANCFTGYSTFRGKPLVNIHDIAVLPEKRGLGIGEMLLDAVANEAKKRGCCKVTLEVRDDNRAKKLYLKAGYKEGNPPMEFLTKEL